MTSAPAILADIRYLAEVVKTRLSLHFGNKPAHPDINKVPRPEHTDDKSPYARFIAHFKMNQEEHIAFLVALLPHIQSDIFDQIISQALPQAGDFPQLGGVRGKQHRGFLPTGETVLFIIAGNDLTRRFSAQNILGQEHYFVKQQILWLEDPEKGEPIMSGKLILSPEYIELFTQGYVSKPKFGISFPAQQIQTQMEWDDLVLTPQTIEQIRELENWVQHGDTLMKEWGMGRKLKPGYRVLFHGPPGTGKTLTASLLGKYTGKDVYKIDLSMIVSKFIGETEKNLSNLFDRAENKDWILFFDEADALFGKRTNVRDAHDKYANQEVSYLLQRVEGYNGLVILASNFKSNIDDAFVRRFQAMIHFPMPKPQERLTLWEKAFPPQIQLNGLDLRAIAQKYELSGASIMNIVQHGCLQALGRSSHTLSHADLVTSIRREFEKEGRII